MDGAIARRGLVWHDWTMSSESNPQDLAPLIAPAPIGTPPGADRPVSGARKTLAGELRQQLADEIVRGVLAPGAALDETEIARRFQVSRTPVREAMAELEALCAKIAAERMMSAERAALEAVHEELRLLVRYGNPQRYHEINE